MSPWWPLLELLMHIVHVLSWCFVLNWGRVTHKCGSNLTIIGSDNGLSPGRRQAIIWTNDGILLTGSFAKKPRGILIKIHTSSFNKMHWKMLSRKCLLFCFGLDVSSQITATDLNIRHLHMQTSLGHNITMYQYIRSHTIGCWVTCPITAACRCKIQGWF